MLQRLTAGRGRALVTDHQREIPIGREVETAKIYADVEKMRFEERLNLEFEVDDASLQALVPSFLVMQLLENSIKYGVSLHELGANISIRIGVSNSRLVITMKETLIDTDGVPSRTCYTRAPLGDGRKSQLEHRLETMADIRRYLEHTIGADHKFEASQSSEGRMYTFEVRIPFQEAASLNEP
jgi:LytS/YehU family sensor histidine kinase